jgi:hypothetical protein
VILVDTSVWIRFPYNREPYLSVLDEFLQREEVVGHELVYGELLIGDRAGRVKLLETYSKLEYAATVAHDEVVQFVRSRRLHGRGVRWIDLHLLASAILGRHQLWSANTNLTAIAEEFGVAWKNSA